ncbi:MAG: hypothetical protein M1816_002171 [Peltula sp. TS41687]|nr:MAG: hypothetical protein M1816_002171 [Peltula sp. TS41687]
MPPTHPQQNRSPKSAQRHSFRSLPADRRCRALHEDGSDCRGKLLHASHTLCPSHHQEYKKLHESYKRKEKYYDSIETREGEADTKDKIEAKLAAGKETLELRDQVNRWFFNPSAPDRGHNKWIMKLQSDVRGLERKLADGEAEESASSSPPAQKDRDTETKVFRPLLHPAIPMSALSHLPPDSPAIVLRLYSTAPSLNDSSPVVLDEVSHAAREPDARDFVIRFLFRELLLYKADADVLARANRTQSIDTILRESSVQHLEHYLQFFRVFREGRDDTFCFLRDAVCHYLLDPQSSSTTLLGAAIAMEDSPRRMNTEGWDVLWANFHDIVQWWDLERFAIRFEDLVVVKALIACLRYGSVDPGDDDVPNWYLPDQDVSQECVLAVIQGFIAVTKGFYDPGRPSAETEHGIAKERQTRCYLVGRMSRKDLLARQLAQELRERVARFQVLVYDREGETAGTPRLVSPSPADQNPWIRRSRSAPTKEALGSQPWMIEWSLENILGDLELIHDLRDRNMARDYYEFIIIDRTPGRTFDILDVVADALSKLKGDLPYGRVFRQVIQKYVPAEEQDKYWEAVAQMDFVQTAQSASHQYLGNRVRCWDVADVFPGCKNLVSSIS